MYNVTRLIHSSSDNERNRLILELRSAVVDASAVGALVQPTLPGARNGGDILMHLVFWRAEEWRAVSGRLSVILDAPAVSHLDGVEYGSAAIQTVPGRPLGSIYRTLLLRVAPETDVTTVERFEADLALMPHYAESITAWRLSRVRRAIGASAWTHVFEQHFTDVDGLMGPYLMHPIHWAYVDRWFDPECPEVIVRDRVCHSFCRIGVTT